MTVFLNGERVECAESRTVEELVEHLRLPAASVLVEQNGKALRRRDWATNVLQEDDRFEILQIAAGG